MRRSCGRKRLVEVCKRLAPPPVKVRLNLVGQDVPAPSELDGLAGVPKPHGRVFHTVDEDDTVAPRQLSNKLLDN